ncbi:hypothetical protein [Erwinia piriflorinigrans]|uniref:hypothetical protein n=1 Tax=Erwinia piriflorinigrans TaxID=665097 RepID=UPI000B267C8C|nr:hypothetical protein [Erwinia piriflorinigrans]
MFLKIILPLLITLPACMMTNASAVTPDFGYKAPEPSPSPAPLTDPFDRNQHSSPSLHWKVSEPKAQIRMTSECNTSGCRYLPNTRRALPKTHQLRQNDPFSADHSGEGSMGITFDFSDNNN